MKGLIVSKNHEIDLAGLPKGMRLLKIGNKGYKIVKTE